MKKIFILFLTLIVSFFFIEKNTPVKAEGVPILDKLGEISKIQIVDSVGRFEKTSNKKYKYTYVKLSYNEEFGFYYHPNATTESIDISLSDMPKIAFDSNENLINGYYSINNNYWYKCEVKHLTNEVHFNWTYMKNEIGFYDDTYCYFEIYFNFDFNFDVIFELSYKLPLYYDQPIGKDVFVSTFECFLKNDSYVTILDKGNFSDALSFIFTKKGLFYEKSALTNGDYFVNGKNYNCKTIFVDDQFMLFDANPSLFHSKNILEWPTNSEKNRPTYFNKRYFPDNENADGTTKSLDASCVYSYKCVLYSFEHLDGNLNRPDDRPIADSRDPLDKIKDLLPDFSLPSWVKPLIIVLVILLIVLFIVFVFSKIRQNQLLKYQVKKEKTNSYRGGNYDK